MSLCAAVLQSCSAASFLMLGKIYSLLAANQSKRHNKVSWQGNGLWKGLAEACSLHRRPSSSAVSRG